MKLDKKELVVLILAKVFPDLSDAEKESVKTQIEFLFNNGKIKKVKTSKKVWYYFKEWVKRRFLYNGGLNSITNNYPIFGYFQSPTDFLIFKFIIAFNLNPLIATSILLLI